RTGKLLLPPNMNQDLLQMELEYFQMPTVELKDTAPTIGKRSQHISLEVAWAKHKVIADNCKFHERFAGKVGRAFAVNFANGGISSRDGLQVCGHRHSQVCFLQESG